MINEKRLSATSPYAAFRENPDKALLELQTSLADKVGQIFFDAVVSRLNHLVQADYTMIGAVDKTGTRVNTISLCNHTTLLPNIDYFLQGTPCQDVSEGGVCIINSGVAHMYPDDALLREMGVEGYVGISVKNTQQQPIGIVVSLFKGPVSNPDFVRFAFEFMSLRITAEMERLAIEQTLRDHRERYEFALKAGDLGLYDWNIFTDEIVFNARMYEILECAPGEFSHRYAGWLSIVHPDDYERLAVNVVRRIEGGKEFHGPSKYRVRTPAGKYKWIEIESYSFYYDEERKAKRNIGIVKEIDEQVQTENQLRAALEREVALNREIKQREERYAFALKVGNLGVYDWYIKEDRATFSPRLYEMIGYEPGEFIATFSKWLSIVHPDDHWQFNWYTFHELSNKNPNTLHLYRLRNKSGIYRWVEAQNMAIEKDEHGYITRMIGIIKDVDNEKHSADLLHQAFERQKELNDELRRREEELTESQSKLIAHMSLLQKANKNLRESENRWVYALEGNGDGVWDWDVGTNAVFLTPKAQDHIGVSFTQQGDGQKFLDSIHPNFLGEFRTQVALCLKPPFDPFVMEMQIKDTTGAYRWLLFRGKAVEFDGEKPVRMVGTVADLSTQKVIQKELTVYEEMIKQNQSAILFTSMNGTIEFLNATASDLLEYRQHEIIEKDVALLLPENSATHLLSENFRNQQIFVSQSGKRVTTQVATSMIRQDGEPIGYVLNIMDITEKRRLEDEVMNLTLARLSTELETQRRQTEMIIRVQENEKETLARELHDGVGQLMSLAKLQLEQLESSLSPDLQQQCKGVLELMQHVTTDLKGLTSDLMPLSMRKMGLESAVTSLLERYNAVKGKSVAITSKIHLDGFELPPDASMHVYRIAQEAINNAMKYSHATSLSLMLMKLKNSINLIIEDNGRGFDVEAELSRTNSFGLKTMRERAKLVHGRLMINAAAHAGTTISLTIPLN